jgi:hypothetical protein
MKSRSRWTVKFGYLSCLIDVDEKNGKGELGREATASQPQPSVVRGG